MDKDTSLRALVDCGELINFFRRQLLDDGNFKFIGCKISPTRMTIRLENSVNVTVIKRVVEICYNLKCDQYDDDFIVLEFDDKLTSSLV